MAGVFVPVLGLSVNVLVQVLGFRYVRSLGMLKSVFLGFGVGLACVIVFQVYVLLNSQFSMGDFLGYLAVNVITYGALGYCYFHFINLGETGRRVRLVRELYDAGGGLTLEEILDRYDAREIVSKRLDRLMSNGQIVYRNGKYYAGKPVVLMISKFMVLLKLVVLGKRSEFE